MEPEKNDINYKGVYIYCQYELGTSSPYFNYEMCVDINYAPSEKSAPTYWPACRFFWE